ncbi:MAG: winged helix-turn-helix transcriptional regulator [Bacilli bacterium]
MNCLQRKILSLIIKKGSCSRKELSSLCSVTLAAITQNTKPLIADNILSLIPSLEDKVGRKEDILVLNEDAFFALGIEKKENHYQYEEINTHRKIRRNILFGSIEELDEYLSLLSLQNCLGITFVRDDRELIDQGNEKEEKVIAYLKSKVENVFICNQTNTLGYAYKSEIIDEDNMLFIDFNNNIEASIFLNGKLFSSYPNIDIGNLVNNQGMKLSDIIPKEQFSFNHKEILSSTERIKNFVSVFSIILHNAIIFFRLKRIIFSGQMFENEKIFSSIEEKVDELSTEQKNSSLLYTVKVDSQIYNNKAALSALYLSLHK